MSDITSANAALKTTTDCHVFTFKEVAQLCRHDLASAIALGAPLCFFRERGSVVSGVIRLGLCVSEPRSSLARARVPNHPCVPENLQVDLKEARRSTACAEGASRVQEAHRERRRVVAGAFHLSDHCFLHSPIADSQHWQDRNHCDGQRTKHWMSITCTAPSAAPSHLPLPVESRIPSAVVVFPFLTSPPTPTSTPGPIPIPPNTSPTTQVDKVEGLGKCWMTTNNAQAQSRHTNSNINGGVTWPCPPILLRGRHNHCHTCAERVTQTTLKNATRSDGG